jgi:hypothetical protein
MKRKPMLVPTDQSIVLHPDDEVQEHEARAMAAYLNSMAVLTEGFQLPSFGR